MYILNTHTLIFNHTYASLKHFAVLEINFPKSKKKGSVNHKIR